MKKHKRETPIEHPQGYVEDGWLETGCALFWVFILFVGPALFCIAGLIYCLVTGKDSL